MFCSVCHRKMALNGGETQLWVQETEILLVLNPGSQSILKIKFKWIILIPFLVGLEKLILLKWIVRNQDTRQTLANSNLFRNIGAHF